MGDREEVGGLARRRQQSYRAQRCPWSGYACNELCGMRDGETGKCAFLEIAQHLEAMLAILRSLDAMTQTPTPGRR